MKYIRLKSKNDNYFEHAMKIYKMSFPIFEQRKIEDQIEVLENEKYNCTVVCEDNELVGILFYWEYDNSRYIEHLAITENLRGMNYGSKILTEFCNSDKSTILEIDNPIDNISIKRLNFYSKLGFKLQDYIHIHPPYRKEFHGHELKVMSYRNNLSNYEYEKFNTFLKYEVMKYSEIEI